MKRKIFQFSKKHSLSIILFFLSCSIGFAVGNVCSTALVESDMLVFKIFEGLCIASMLGLAIFAICYILLDIWLSK